MKHNKLQRMSSLIEWILLFTMLATPLTTMMVAWSHLLGGDDFLQQELLDTLTPEASTLLTIPMSSAEDGAIATQPAPPSVDDYPLNLTTRLLATLVMLLPDIIFISILWQLRQLFHGYRHGLLFTFGQIRHYQKIGLLLCTSFVISILTTPLLSVVLTMQGPEVHGSVTIGSSDFQLLLVGLIVLALALVMREAKQLADEQQLTV
ncbi:DUF2975 domain-containing protein [Aeromonas veronii]|uniref:DUF2975 domain-containing protein n=1 Tax=Aeromonas veronii TaxID=654 RepID=UPI0015E79B55|nr:DUF2975 domain-containing protein [Aeromonas veronii]MBA2073368.1 hypothetical protein [Aeromonas veronii]